jgi:hypothetical protein
MVVPRANVWFVTDGHAWWGPWRSLWAAERCAAILRRAQGPVLSDRLVPESEVPA